MSIAGLALVFAVTPILAGPPANQLPEPGTPNCFGKMVSYHAREYKGIGRWVRVFFGLHPQDKLNEWRDYCVGEEPEPTPTPTIAPSPSPTINPTVTPSPSPTLGPTPTPTLTPNPTSTPTPEPTFDPGSGF